MDICSVFGPWQDHFFTVWTASCLILIGPQDNSLSRCYAIHQQLDKICLRGIIKADHIEVAQYSFLALSLAKVGVLWHCGVQIFILRLGNHLKKNFKNSSELPIILCCFTYSIS